MVALPSKFREALCVAGPGGSPLKLQGIIDPWQQKDYKAIDPALQTVARQKVHGNTKVYLRAYLERGRGHSKTTDIAICATWLLWAGKHKIKGVIASGDRDQAKLVRDAIDTLLRLNPWLSERIEVQRGLIGNRETGSTLEVLSSDASSSFGLLVDFIICDELTHWRHEGGRRYWEAIFSAVAKRNPCLLLIIANAGDGKGTSWQWNARELARTSEEWYFSRLDGVQASWVTEKDIEEQRQALLPSTFRRLWMNEWLSGLGDALEESDIMACLNRSHAPMQNNPRYVFVAGLDIGIKHDRSALAVVGIDQLNQRAKLAECLSWKPGPPTGDVQLAEVEAAVEQMAERFPGLVIAYDPDQCEYVAQRLRMRGVDMRPFTFTGQHCNLLAVSLIQAFRTRAIELYDDAELIADLGRLSIEPRQFGYKLVAPSDSAGHADKAIALAIALAMAPQVFSSYEPEQPEYGGSIV